MDKDSLKKQWKKRVAEFKNSGMSISGWCRANNIKASTFRYWLDKEKNKVAKSNASTWLPVNINNDDQVSQHTLTVKIGCASVEIKEGFNKELFQEIVEVLKTSC